MIPKIGVKSYDLLSDIEDKLKEFDVLEITTRDKVIAFHSAVLKDLRKNLKDKDLSVHSQTGRVFMEREKGVEEFKKVEIWILKAEIILAKLINAKELIFHLKEEPLNNEEKEKLKEIINFANEKGVEMLYESNPFFKGETAISVLKDFPELKYNLDLGHLNTSIESGNLGMPLKIFLNKIKDRTVYIHAHNNYGLKDEHLSLTKGTLDWKYVLDKFDLSKIKKIIIEARAFEDVIETKKVLEDYFKYR